MTRYQLKKVKEGLCRRFDEIELRDPDTSTKKWKQYKFIRNTISDYIDELIDKHEQ